MNIQSITHSLRITKQTLSVLCFMKHTNLPMQPVPLIQCLPWHARHWACVSVDAAAVHAPTAEVKSTS